MPRSWDTSLYVLVGIRLIRAERTNPYRGCLMIQRCSPGDFASGTDGRGPDSTARTYGAGVEKLLGDQLALRVETRFTQCDGERGAEWFSDVGVTVPTRVDPDEVGPLSSVAWYF